MLTVKMLFFNKKKQGSDSLRVNQRWRDTNVQVTHKNIPDKWSITMLKWMSQSKVFSLVPTGCCWLLLGAVVPLGHLRHRQCLFHLFWSELLSSFQLQFLKRSKAGKSVLLKSYFPAHTISWFYLMLRILRL